MKKLIETALPLSAINRKTIAERTASPGHPANMHIWWGRSPQTSSLYALNASLIDACEDREELLRRMDRLSDNCFTEFGEKPKVFDPFSGYGGIPIAAQKLGLSSVSSEINPLAVMLSKAAIEIPSIFCNCSPVNQTSLINEYRGAKGLSEDVLYYGEWMHDKAQEMLEPYYPNEPQGVPAAWIWARTVKCPNPACNCDLPMFSSSVINGKAGQEAWADPVVSDGQIHFEVRKGKWPKEKETNKYGNYGAKFICPACGTVTTDEYIKQEGRNHRFGAKLMAVVVDTPNGRVYNSPNENQISAAEIDAPENVPKGDIPNNPHWFGPPGFGIETFGELFSPRQLKMLCTFCDLLPEVQAKAASDALAAGMSPTGGGLAEGGKGALAYGQAIGVYLSFVIDKMADRNSTACSWNGSNAGPRATFGRQAIAMIWNYAEGNPFSTITGNFHTALKNVAASISELPCDKEAQVSQDNAVTGTYPENVMLCTELPYYKAVGYAHLSDFFYIWMRRSLKAIFPNLFNSMLSPKEELTTVGQYYGENAEECNRKYEEQLKSVIGKFYQCANPAYPSLMFYEYHKADARGIKTSSSAATAWETMLTALVEVGFAVNAVWPMRTESASEKMDGTRVLIVARKQEKTNQTTRRGYINTLKRELPDLLDTAFCAGVDDCDKEIVGMGMALSVFTRYKNVINADGSAMTIHDALQINSKEISDIIGIAPAELTECDTMKEE